MTIKLQFTDPESLGKEKGSRKRGPFREREIDDFPGDLWEWNRTD